MLRLAWILCLAVVATGLVVLAAAPTSAGRHPALLLHWGAGWGLVLAGGPALWRHLRATKSPWQRPAAALILVAACAMASIGGLDAPHDRGLIEHLATTYGDLLAGRPVVPYFAFAPVALLLLGTVAVLSGLGGIVAPVRGRRSARWSGLCVTLLVAWACGTAIAQPWVGRDSIFLAISAHSATGSAAAVALALHVLSSRLWKREAPTPRARAALALGLLVAGGAMAGAHRVNDVRAHRDRTQAPGVFVARTPADAAERAASLTDAWEHLPTGALRDSLSCGEAACHPDVTAEWRGSVHRFSASNRLYRAAVDDLLPRGGLEAVALCAGCHDPERALTGRLGDYAGGAPAGGSDGVSCLVCHGMIASPPTPGNGVFTLAAGPTAYGGWLGRRALGLDPRHHDHVLGVGDFVLSEGPCRACHRLELGPDHGLADSIVLQNTLLDGPAPSDAVAFCERCHLGVARRAFDRYRHETPGIHLDLAATLEGLSPEDESAVAAVHERTLLMAGAAAWMPIQGPAWPPPAPPAPPDLRVGDPTLRALDLQIAGRIDGGRLHLSAVLTNQRIGHPFPAGPLDLQQVWLELRVADAAGRVLHHVGALEGGRIQGTPPRLGGREVDAAGRDIEHHRLLDLAAVVDKRILPLGGTVEDVVEVPVPDDAVFPLDVRARWLFRRANPGFTAWAMDGAVLPAWELAADRVDVAPP